MLRGEPTKTIGDARAGGEKALTVHCLGCYNHAVKTFEELKLWNDMIFVDVPKRRLVCSKCGSRNVFPDRLGIKPDLEKAKTLYQEAQRRSAQGERERLLALRH
jgi:hypothetical protein